MFYAYKSIKSTKQRRGLRLFSAVPPGPRTAPYRRQALNCWLDEYIPIRILLVRFDVVFLTYDVSDIHNLLRFIIFTAMCYKHTVLRCSFPHWKIFTRRPLFCWDQQCCDKRPCVGVSSGTCGESLTVGQGRVCILNPPGCLLSCSPKCSPQTLLLAATSEAAMFSNLRRPSTPWGYSFANLMGETSCLCFVCFYWDNCRFTRSWKK